MNLKISTSVLCEKTGMSRQNVYKGRKERIRRKANVGLIEELVKAERALQPRLGASANRCGLSL